MRPALRSRALRKADTLALRRTEVACWVASADEMGNAHLVPHPWAGAALVLVAGRVTEGVDDAHSVSLPLDA